MTRRLSWLVNTVLIWIVVGLSAAVIRSAECDSVFKGFPTLDSVSATYLGLPCGLYPGGKNIPPTSHDSAGRALAGQFTALDSLGHPDPNGRWVLLSVGMSNTTQEFSQFVLNLVGDTTLHPNLRVVDGAQGGQTAARIRYDTAQFWRVIETRLGNLGLSPLQVQAIWMKEANAGPTEGFPSHAVILQADLSEVVRVAKRKYPNLRQLFLSSRIYAGYASTTLNPEPYAYESGFAVRWLIEDQLNGAASLNPYPDSGPVLAPWLAWGPYLWADGQRPRPGDSLQWFCADLSADGTHPSPAGREKVAGLLEQYFKTNPYTIPWFLAAGHGSPGLRGDLDQSGAITSADIIVQVGVVFKGSIPSFPPAWMDVDCSGSPTSADIIYLVNYVFKAGPAPCPL